MAYHTTLQTVLDDTYTNSASPDTNFGTSPELWISSQNNTFIKYDLSSITTEIVSAEARVVVIDEQSGSPATVSAYKVTEDWKATEVTWNKEPSYDPNPLDTNSSVIAGGPAEFDVSAVAEQWRLRENYGITLRMVSGSRKECASSRYTAPSSRPSIIVVHRLPGPTIDTINGTQTNPTKIENSNTPELKGTFADPASSQAGVGYEFQVLDEIGGVVYSTGKVSETVNHNSQVSHTVPAGNLPYGKLLQWRWRVYDHEDIATEWSGSGWFYLYDSTVETPNYTDGGNPIEWELVLGPTLFNTQKDKVLSRIDVVLALDSGATCNIEMAISEKGSYTTAKSITVTTAEEPETKRVFLPLNSGDLLIATTVRIRLTGTGHVRILDVVPVYRVRRL